MATPVEGQTTVMLGCRNARERAALPTRKYTAAVSALRRTRCMIRDDQHTSQPSSGKTALTYEANAASRTNTARLLTPVPGTVGYRHSSSGPGSDSRHRRHNSRTPTLCKRWQTSTALRKGHRHAFFPREVPSGIGGIVLARVFRLIRHIVAEVGHDLRGKQFHGAHDLLVRDLAEVEGTVQVADDCILRNAVDHIGYYL